MARGILLSTVACFLAFFVADNHGLIETSRPRHDKVVVCYVASWAAYRPGKGQFQFENLRPEHCTHLIYAFAGLNVTTWSIRSLDPWADLEEDYGKGTYRKMTGLRRQYPGLKVSLAIGGWNEGSANYSALASSPTRRGLFVNSVLQFMKNYDFDGLDLDWEFPGKRGGAPQDKQNFVSLVQELSGVLKSRGLLLTAAISADRATIDAAYDVPEISKYLDFIHLMAYDYHGAWDKKVLPNAPLQCDDELCVEKSINHLMKLGAPVDKLVLGLPMYGRTFILASMPKNDSEESPIGAPALDQGFMGNFTREFGFLGYNEICRELSEFPNTWRTGWYEDGYSAYAVNGDRVVVYDNVKSLVKKAAYVTKMRLAGVMIWSIDTDDFRGDCSKLHADVLDPLISSDYPLMRSINLALTKSTEIDDNSIESFSPPVFLSGYIILSTCFIYVW
ncbi:probable chitinase 2 [Venturia canescens]|uniref:probable chitinase 2 n=1 Tax=Venturia canescens TaxID=32260 RepID=UPI001C9C2750|nr:probable chitinase 2 [Venturia canescens]